MKPSTIATCVLCLAACAFAQWQAAVKVMPPTISGLDEVGWSVGMSGPLMISGSRNDDTPMFQNCGSASIWRRNASGWAHEATLFASDAAAMDRLGQSVAISGNVAVVGANTKDGPAGVDQGAAYVWRFNGSVWVQEAKLLAAGGMASDYFGWSVDIDGDLIVVGAYGHDEGGMSAGAAYVFTHSSGDWSQKAKLKATDADASDYFGVAVACSGQRVIVGAYLDEHAGASAGSAYVFRDNGQTWVQEAKLLGFGLSPDDRFGQFVAISGDVAVAAAIHDDDKGTNAGAAYVFERQDMAWIQRAKLVAADGSANDKFGSSVSCGANIVAVGAWWDDEGALSDTGSAYTFKRAGSGWAQEARHVATDPYFWEYFGSAVAVTDDRLAVGAYQDNSGGMDAGAVYVFEKTTAPPPECLNDSGCSDGNACTLDKCVAGKCMHCLMSCAPCSTGVECCSGVCTNGSCIEKEPESMASSGSFLKNLGTAVPAHWNGACMLLDDELTMKAPANCIAVFVDAVSTDQIKPSYVDVTCKAVAVNDPTKTFEISDEGFCIPGTAHNEYNCPVPRPMNVPNWPLPDMTITDITIKVKPGYPAVLLGDFWFKTR